jgi:hypothetical protein
MAVFCISLTSWLPGMVLTYFLNDFEMVPVAPIATGITLVFTFHLRLLLLLLLLLPPPQLSFHLVTVVLTLVKTKQIRINIHKRNNTKYSANNTKHSKYKYTDYQNTHTYTQGVLRVRKHGTLLEESSKKYA